ncbi:MAG: hypothetical protein AAF733_13550 [Verrucomicrobiota bacterium]
MNSGLFVLVGVASLSLLVILRWSHRCWAKAFLSTLFAPLIAAPLAAVSFMAIAFLLRLLDRFLNGFGIGFTNQTLSVVAGTITALFLLVLAIHYCREQRHLSLIETGPRLGPKFSAPRPDVYRLNGPKI